MLRAETKLLAPLSMLSLYHLFKALFKDGPYFRVFHFWFYFCKLCASDVSWKVPLQLQKNIHLVIVFVISACPCRQVFVPVSSYNSIHFRLQQIKIQTLEDDLSVLCRIILCGAIHLELCCVWLVQSRQMLVKLWP